MHTIIAKILTHKALVIMLALTATDGFQTHYFQQRTAGLPPKGQYYYSQGLRRQSPGRPCDLNPLIGCHPYGFEVAPDAILALVLHYKHVRHEQAFTDFVVAEEGLTVAYNFSTWNSHKYPKPDGTGPSIVRFDPAYTGVAPKGRSLILSQPDALAGQFTIGGNR